MLLPLPLSYTSVNFYPSTGHGKFEGRRPALFDSLTQAFLTAPFFVFFEYCFFFGLFQELHHEVC